MKTRFIFFSIAAMVFFRGTAFAAAGAEIKPTSGDSKVSGKVVFAEVPGGLKVTADVEGATPGEHGFHIHENGSCEDAGKAAGSHFNPEATTHGLLIKDGLQHAHAGDLGNLEVGPDGKGHYEATVPNLTLGPGRYSIAGRSVIFHEKEDDFGQPAGNAGGRAGCGEITVNA